MCKDKLEQKLNQYETEFKNLMNDTTMRDMCFTACGCGNRATKNKLTSYRNKLGDLTNKISAIKLALKIINKEVFTHEDIINTYTDFLKLRNPELYYDICSECLTIKSIKEVITLVIKLFLPLCKNQVLKTGLIYTNRTENINIELINTAKC